MMTKLGFIGTGHLTSFFVEGLSRVKADYDITVSARNHEHSAALARRFGVKVHTRNQAIVDDNEMIVVAVLPQQAREVLQPLKFRAGQNVLSVMAGVTHNTMAELVNPAQCAISIMPGLANAHNVGPSAMYPANPALGAMLAQLGPLHVYQDAETYAAAGTMGAFSGMSVLMMRDAIAWYEANGVDPADARRLVAETLRGNATMLLESPLPMASVAQGVVTRGGITEQGRKILDGGGSWADALDAILKRMRGA